MKAILVIAALLVVDITNANPIRCNPTRYLAYCPRIIATGRMSSSRYLECCCHPYIVYASNGGIRNCNAHGFSIRPRPRPTPPPTSPPPTTAAATTTTTTYKPHEQMDDMIDQFSSLWPQHSEDTFLTVEEGTDELAVIDISSVQENKVDQGTFYFRKGRCGKFPRAVSIESKLHSGKFWRHQEGKIKIEGSEETEDICFNVVKAGCDDGGFALQAANIPRKFVQKCGDKVELRTRADNCGDDKNMCWANPVSEQASLAFCETKVTTTDDVHEYPQCCSHEGTLDKFGACCRENITSCSYSVRPLSGGGSSALLIRPWQLQYCLNYIDNIGKLQLNRQCCLHPYIYHKHKETCQRMGLFLRKKRAQAACNMPCWKINYCPNRMRRDSGWEKGYNECCCHPYRITMIKNSHPNKGTC